LLARFRVSGAKPVESKAAFKFDVSGLDTTYFSDLNGKIVPEGVLERKDAFNHREVSLLTAGWAGNIEALCERTDDFSQSQSLLHPSWRATVVRLEIETARAFRRGDRRPGVEVAFDFLRANYLTSELPGPKPVYLNAIRRAFQISMQSDDHSSTSPLRAVRNEHYLQWGPLTDDAIEKGINEDISSVTTTPPDSRRHQQILQQLRDRLLELGFAPEYNGFVDCKISCESGDVYFEVKSASQDTFVHQMRLGVGQLLHYIWKDHKTTSRPIRGFLVIEDVSAREGFKDFVHSVPFDICLSSDISDLQIDQIPK